jgi:hypothetical protein
MFATYFAFLHFFKTMVGGGVKIFIIVFLVSTTILKNNRRSDVCVCVFVCLFVFSNIVRPLSVVLIR